MQSERSELISDLQPFRAERRKYSTTIDEKMKEIKPLRSDLQDHRTVRERGMGLCSSEEELNDLVRLDFHFFRVPLLLMFSYKHETHCYVNKNRSGACTIVSNMKATP